jgi:hypothetical protein
MTVLLLFNELIYREGEKVMRVSIQTTPSFSAGTPELLFEGRYLQIPIASWKMPISAIGHAIAKKELLLTTRNRARPKLASPITLSKIPPCFSAGK